MSELENCISWYKKIYYTKKTDLKWIVNHIEKKIITDRKTEMTQKELDSLQLEINNYRNEKIN